MSVVESGGQGFYALPKEPWSDFRTLLAKHQLPRIESTALRAVYGKSLDDFERICKPRDVHSIDEHCIRYFVVELLDEGFSRQTVAAALMVVADALLWAKDRGLRLNDVFWGDALKAIEVHRQEAAEVQQC